MALALLVCVVLPAYSWHDGSGWLAWTMFSKSETYRISIRVVDANGAERLINPTELARYADGDAATFLSGADHFRQGPVGRTFASNLASLAALTCRAARGKETFVTLEVRKNLDAATQKSSATAHCS